ncbi:MAG: hypothetical protein ABSH21_03745 [Verrucomicrobiia bacterium]
MPERRARTEICLAVVLFFGFMGLLQAADPQQAELEELRVVLEKLRASDADLKQRHEQREAVIRKLQESLAIARTESDLFQKKWMEAQLRAQMLGVNFADADATQTQRQLIESVRSLYLAEAERQRLIGQIKRLLAAVESNRDVAAEIERTKTVLAAAETQGQATTTQAAQSTLESAKVLEVNPKLQLVVLDVGMLQGARVGMPFLVVRGDRAVAELRVVEVRRRICGALIEKVEKGVALAVGDAARVTKS